MLPNGEFGFYDKRHLFAYGKEDQHYSPGNKRLIASVNGWKINLQICYDLRFPVWLRQSKSNSTEVKPEYDLLIVVANWPSVKKSCLENTATGKGNRKSMLCDRCKPDGQRRKGTWNTPENRWSLVRWEKPSKYWARKKKYFRIHWTVRNLEDIRFEISFLAGRRYIFHSTINYETGFSGR